jgi:hypothetical protein
VSSAVLGIDIRPDGGFSYVVMGSDGSIIDGGNVDAGELIRVIKRFKPSVLAVDNIRELLELGGRFLKRMGKLPAIPQIIQVTRLSDGSEVRMEDLVKRYLGINVSVLTPEQTAKYAAELALRNVGSIVRLFENETKIVVKALISTKQGGQSRRRFERNMAIRIRHIVKDVTEALNRANLDYDVFYHKDSEGVRSALIIVYADKPTVRKVIRPIKSIDVKVTLEQVVSSSVKFIPPGSGHVLETSPKSRTRLIIGVDPGIVTGLAIMNLDGKVLALFSGRNMSRRRVLSLVYDYGTPVVVATDVSKPSDYVKKLAAMVGAVLYHPDKDLQITEKAGIALKLSERDDVKVKTPHERDALAAAYKAYMSYLDKFNRVNELLGELPIQVNADEVKELVIRGLPIREALSRVLGRGVNQECKPEVIIRGQQECRCDDKVKELKDYVRLLEEKVNRLEIENTKLRDEVNRLYTLKYTPPDQSLASKIKLLEDRVELEVKRNRELKETLTNVKAMVANALNGKGLAFAVRVSNGEELAKALSRGFLPIVRFQEISTLIDLSKGWAGTVVTIDDVGARAIRQLFKLGITVVPLSKVLALDVSDDVKIVNIERIGELVNELRSALSEVDYELLEDLVNEYRVSRKNR